MIKFARLSNPVSFKIYDISPPFSFFKYIESAFRGLYSLHRLLSQVRTLGANTMIEENINYSQDIIEENEDIKKRFNHSCDSDLIRLSFYLKRFKTKRGLYSINDNDFLGYIIIKKDFIQPNSQNEFLRIYESVLINSNHPDNYIRGKQKWKCNILGDFLSVNGYLYAQQNDMTNVCAHVALRTAAARYHSDGDMTYREMNNIAGIDHVNKKAGGKDGDGLTSQEMIKILEAAGARCFYGDYTSYSDTPVPFQKYLYGSIESGFPSIVFFGTSHTNSYHTIPVFGHTFNKDTWVPNADFSYFKVGAGTQYIPSESWLSMFIAHDDNFGSNYCIPRRYLSVRKNCTINPSNTIKCPYEPEGVAYAISTIPNELKMDPIRAEVIGADFLFTILPQMTDMSSIWCKRLMDYASRSMLVLRPIIISGSDYINYLDAIRDWDDNRIDSQIIKILKKYLTQRFYWLIELSLPELFSANKRKVGEILLRANQEPGESRDMSSFVLSRLPGYLVLYDSGGASNPIYGFIPSGIDGHCPLIYT